MMKGIENGITQVKRVSIIILTQSFKLNTCNMVHRLGTLRFASTCYAVVSMFAPLTLKHTKRLAYVSNPQAS